MIINLDLPIKLERKLQAQAGMNQISLNQLIERLLIQFLNVQLTSQENEQPSLSGEKTVRSQIQHLSEIGLLAWNGNKLSPITPITPLQKWRTVADLLLEDRG